MKKAIVTGANGFIGTALCKELAEQGIRVIAVVRNESEDVSEIKNLKGLEIKYSDISNFGKLHEIIKDNDIDVLYHLAWIGSSGPLRGEVEVQINNAKYTCELVKACTQMGCKKFVFASSIMEYEVLSLMETDSTPGINTLYCSAKLAADYMARTVAGNVGVDYIRAVISNIYGPGEMSPRLINSSIRKLLAGEHCAFSTGNQMYDFIYISDAAKVFCELGRKGRKNKTYYIGSLNPRPLKEFLLEMKDQVNPDIELGLGELPFQGVSLSYSEFDIEAVKKDTGYVPKVSFKEGIQKTIEWIRGDE